MNKILKVEFALKINKSKIVRNKSDYLNTKKGGGCRRWMNSTTWLALLQKIDKVNETGSH